MIRHKGAGLGREPVQRHSDGYKIDLLSSRSFVVLSGTSRTRMSALSANPSGSSTPQSRNLSDPHVQLPHPAVTLSELKNPHLSPREPHQLYAILSQVVALLKLPTTQDGPGLLKTSSLKHSTRFRQVPTQTTHFTPSPPKLTATQRNSRPLLPRPRRCPSSKPRSTTPPLK